MDSASAISADAGQLRGQQPEGAGGSVPGRGHGRQGQHRDRSRTPDLTFMHQDRFQLSIIPPISAEQNISLLFNALGPGSSLFAPVF